MTSSPPPRILLVEDDPSLALGLCDTLEFEGFEVKHARTGQDGIHSARQDHPDCIILDLMLPDTNGYRVCELIRKDDPVVPIIMLTARSQEADKIRGLDVGADDYVTKPFSVGELVARIRAIFRRMNRSPQKDAPIQVGDAEIDPAAQVLRRGRSETKLSFYEVQLLKLLFERAGQPVSRDEILDKVWGIETASNNRTVDNFVVKLRKKVEPQPEEPRHILTVYGVGYKLVV
ncbi:MAG: response regulator transcription factor [Sandaracinaceae bacterium]|nr:response regulator transcription factor [Sandaracinaceae bacterium]